ncbi:MULTISPECIES: hypothetical protein [Actinomyces]|nr:MULTISPECIES: hypothetical protein [Actinomyces]
MSESPDRDDRIAHGTHPRRVLLKLSGEVFGGGNFFRGAELSAGR